MNEQANDNLVATSVCWGAGPGEVPGMIYDFFDDSSLGFVEFFPLVAEDCGCGETVSCPADLDGDGSVGIGDLLILLPIPYGPCEGECVGDIDGDGEVSVLDLLSLLASWGACV